MSQQPARAPVTTSDRIWTIPNMISFVRLLGVPLFLYLLLGPEHDVAAVVVLAIGGTKRWDGWAMLVGAGLSVALLNLFFRIGVSGDREREREEAAREHYGRTGRWPDER
jgi:hypothetical protein